MKMTIGFGDKPQTVVVPDANLMAVLTPNQVDIEHYGEEEVVRALANPVGTPKLREIVNRAKRSSLSQAM